MERILNSLLATAILTHAALGCCAHAVHSDSASEGTQRSGHASASDGCVGLCSEAAGNHESPHREPTHECRHANCLWTNGESSDLMFSHSTNCWLACVLDMEGRTNDSGDCPVTTGPFALGQWAAQPPVRSHLAHRVLLI